MILTLRHFLFVSITAGLAAAISLIGGIGLELVSQKIAVLVPLLIAIPSLNNLVGDYAAIISAHIADPDENKPDLIAVRQAIARVLGFNILIIVGFSAILAAFRGYSLDPAFLIKFLLFVAFSVVVVVESMFVLNFVLNRALKNHRLNADDVLIPITTAVADIAMLLLVALAVVTIF